MILSSGECLLWPRLRHVVVKVQLRLQAADERSSAMRSLSLSVFLLASAAMVAPLLIAMAYAVSVLASALMFP